jgi:uncharacterized protein (TIGR03435 family)
MTQHAPRKLNIGINPVFVVAVFMAIAIPSSQGQAGAAATPAAPANAPYVATMTFDVASVQEVKNADPTSITFMGGGFVAHTAAYRATNLPIESLIAPAYGVNQYQIVKGPSWPWPTLFMVEAKGDSDADAKLAALPAEQREAEQQHMLQALLADRFKLKTHWETREGDTYNLVVAKGGPKLGAAGSTPTSDDDLARFGGHSVPALFQTCDWNGCSFVAHRCSIGELTGNLTSQFRRPVYDKTGITANYDFVLKYKGSWDSDRPADDLDPTPPLDRALQEQLGLKVEPAKGSIKVLVIDHIEKPSAN